MHVDALFYICFVNFHLEIAYKLVLMIYLNLLTLIVLEIISLNIADINFEEGLVMCKTGEKQRNIPLGNLSKEALKDYVILGDCIPSVGSFFIFLFLNKY
mgnify:CR=1 FL=1